MATGIQLEVKGLQDLEESKEHKSSGPAGDFESPVDTNIEADNQTWQRNKEGPLTYKVDVHLAL